MSKLIIGLIHYFISTFTEMLMIDCNFTYAFKVFFSKELYSAFLHECHQTSNRWQTAISFHLFQKAKFNYCLYLISLSE